MIAFDSDGPELDDWQIEEVLAAIEEYDRDPSTARTPEQVRATLEAEVERAIKETESERLPRTDN